MQSEYISKAQVLLQYYTALQELEEENRVMAAGASIEPSYYMEMSRQPLFVKQEVRISL